MPCANRELGLTELGLLVPGEVCDRTSGYVLAVPNKHPLVVKLFEGTHWAGEAGAGGPCKNALRQAPDTIVITESASIACASQGCRSAAA